MKSPIPSILYHLSHRLCIFLIRLTPLDYAVRNGHRECAEELQAHGAVTVSMIREMAATCIQSFFRGFRYTNTDIIADSDLP